MFSSATAVALNLVHNHALNWNRLCVSVFVVVFFLCIILADLLHTWRVHRDARICSVEFEPFSHLAKSGFLLPFHIY